MRAFVFTDPALASEAGRFVWLGIDVEKGKNAAARKAYPAAALPTFFLLDPADGSVVGRVPRYLKLHRRGHEGHWLLPMLGGIGGARRICHNVPA